MAGRRRRRTGKLGKVLCAVFACLFLNEAMKAYLESEKDRAEELEGLKAEMMTRKFVEETARDKFGLAYENEIVFEPEK